MADAPPPNESSEDYAAAHALEYKNRGNAKFKEKDYEGAVQAFSEAIALDPSNAVLYSNRSGAYLAMSHFWMLLQAFQVCLPSGISYTMGLKSDGVQIRTGNPRRFQARRHFVTAGGKGLG